MLKSVAMASYTTSSSQTKGPVRQLTSHYTNTSLFSNDAKIKLNGLALAFQQWNGLTEEQISASGSEQVSESTQQHVISDVMFCNCCQIHFADREEQVIHYKSDWHRYNLHLRLKGLKSVSEEEFELVSGDVSSISGSDEDSESDRVEFDHKLLEPITDTPEINEQMDSLTDRRFNKIFFRNEQGELLSLYKCLLFHKKNPERSLSDLITEASQLMEHQKWAVLMVSSGHFAGAIFNGTEVVDHKTFHRYTVRAKRGSAQSSRDGQGNAPKSAGASLRRYNETALNQEVQALMTNWKNNLDSCSLIFVRIPVGNRAMFYGGKNPVMKKDDLRIRNIPFPTRRPTFSEVKRVQKMLSCIECFGQEADVKNVVPLSPPRFYCKDTDQLEIRPPSFVPKTTGRSHEKKTSPEKSKIKAKEDFEYLSEEDIFELEPLGPGNPLQEFEISVDKKRRKRKPKSGKSRSTDPKDITAPQNPQDEEEIAMKNSIFTACKTGNVESLCKDISDLHKYYLSSEPEKVACDNDQSTENERCANGSDSKVEDDTSTVDTSRKNCSTSITHKKVAHLLNHTTGENANTLLHYASQGNCHEIIPILLEEGADPSLKNKNGKVPYILGNNEVKNAFRRFMANFPEKYDYTQAQIPSPLTPEMEALKKQKNAERRAVKKKSTQERNKVKKAEELKQKEEDDKKERFLNLSDREKRALAAENRILQHHNEQGNPKPILSRCFQCGNDMTGQVPFEYSDFKFCTTKCLRDHRAKPKS